MCKGYAEAASLSCTAFSPPVVFRSDARTTSVHEGPLGLRKGELQRGWQFGAEQEVR